MIDTIYIPGDRFWHRFDIRLKLVLLTFLTVFHFLPSPLWFGPGILLATLLAGAYSVGISNTLRPLRSLLPLFVMMILLTPPFYREGAVLLQWHNTVLVTMDGLFLTLRFLVRFAGISLLFYLFFATTEMDRFLQGLRWFRLPFSWTLVISIALRYIPHMIGIYNNIRTAHALRFAGTEENRGNTLRSRINAVFPSLVSLIIIAVKTIPTLSMALELKGIGLKETRSTFRQLPPLTHPVLQICATCAAIASGVVILIVW